MDNKTKKANNAYNTLGFLSQVMIPLVGELKDTNKPKHLFKKALNDVLRESIAMNNEHYKQFEMFGIVETESDEIDHEALDIYNVTQKAYDKAFEFFTKRSANEVVSIMQLIENLEKDGINLSDILIPYDPIQK